MSGLDWRKARSDGKQKRSIVDDEEYRGSDAAARWLARREKKPAKSKPRLTPAPERAA